MHIAFASEPLNTYTFSYDACFPPLAYCFYYFLWKINPIYESNKLNWEIYKDANNNMLLVCMLYIFISFLLLYLVRKYLNFISFELQMLVTALILLSWPAFGISFQSGNIVILISILLGIAYYLRNRQSKVSREIALILIAVATGFKIYPAFAGILYLKEKRWSEACRLFLYGIVLFFLPFIFFGGIEGMKNFFWLLFIRELETVYRYNTVRGGINTIFKIAGFNVELGNILAIVGEQVFLLLSVIMILLSKSEWKTAVYIGAVLSFYVPTNYSYTAVYFIPGFLCFLKEKYENVPLRLIDLVYLFLFSNVFSLPFYFKIINYPLGNGIFIYLFILVGIIFVEDMVKLKTRNAIMI